MVTTECFYPDSLDDEYMDILRLKNDLSTVNIKIKVRKSLIYKHSKSEHKTKVDKSYIASTREEIIHLEEQKKRLEAKIDSFPPLPVLPPPEPLIKISGTVDEITYTKALACFDVGAYITMQEQLERKRRRDNIGTSAAMVAQVLAGSAPHVGKTDNVWQRDKSVYVQGKIDGKPFAGWVADADIEPGEQVEMAVVEKEGEYQVYAIHVPCRNIAYLPPKCQRGSSNTAKDYFKTIAAMYIFFSPIFIFPMTRPGKFIGSLVVYSAFSVVLGSIVFYRITKRNRPYWDFFKKIDDVLHLEGFGMTKANPIGVFTKASAQN